MDFQGYFILAPGREQVNLDGAVQRVIVYGAGGDPCTSVIFTVTMRISILTGRNDEENAAERHTTSGFASLHAHSLIQTDAINLSLGNVNGTGAPQDRFSAKQSVTWLGCEEIA